MDMPAGKDLAHAHGHSAARNHVPHAVGTAKTNLGARDLEKIATDTALMSSLPSCALQNRLRQQRHTLREPPRKVPRWLQPAVLTAMPPALVSLHQLRS